MRVVLHNPHFALPDGATSATNESLDLVSHDTWTNEGMPPAPCLPILRLPAPAAIIIDEFGHIYGMQVMEEIQEDDRTTLLQLEAKLLAQTALPSGAVGD